MFEVACGWQMGVEFQIMSVQIATAQLFGGDTIHHACGINPFGQKTDPKTAQKAAQRQTEVAERIARWRWIFIDEISMVSAKLLAEIDMKLRHVMSDVGTTKKGAQGRTRAFGGINLLCCGDLWQLDPPGGGFLGSIPVEFMRKAMKYDAKPDIAHGQAIFWHEGEGSIQGVTELTECVRTEDPWLYEVQQQMRSGKLSQDSSCFLHGYKTTVPGSWVNGAPECGKNEC